MEYLLDVDTWPLTHGRSLLDIVHPEDRLELETRVRPTFEGGDYDVEFRVVGDDGRTRWLRCCGYLPPALSGQAATGLGAGEWSPRAGRSLPPIRPFLVWPRQGAAW